MLKPILIKLTCAILAVIAGICLFSATTAIDANRSIMNPEFHRQLFEKNNIYSHTQSLIQSSMTDFINNLKKYSPQDFEQHGDIFYVLQKSTTPEMIKTNLDSVRNGLFDYFKGNRQFLPDIYLDTHSIPVNSTSKSLIDDSNKLSYALTKIDKINLSLILQYINRNDITDRLSVIKLIFYLVNKVPGFSILIFLLLLVCILIFSRKTGYLSRWVAISLITCGFLVLAEVIFLIIYSYWLIPKNIYPLTSSIPIQPDVLISYIRDCTVNISKSLIIFGLLYFVLAAVLYLLPKIFPSLYNNCNDHKKELKKLIGIIKYTSCSILFLLIISILIYKSYAFKKDFYANDFPVVVSKIKNANTVTQVISAKDTAIYSLLVRLVDKKTDTPVSSVEINISGESIMQKKSFNQTFSTDELGEAKYSLDKGTFRVSFVAATFPSNYLMPSPFYFDLKTAGTKIITVSLDNLPESNSQSWGIAELEVLDKDNKPISDLDLSVEGVVLAPGFPNDVNSVTNSEGIAVFKLSGGNFKIGFAETNFPKQYIQPHAVDVTVSANTVTRYTIKLAEKKKSSH